jgi:putative hydroxymethylpyrimidine transport system substrate-binding protein
MRGSRVLIAGLVTVLLIGCGGGSDSSSAPKLLRPVSVTLDGWRGPENLGILMADVNGYFAEVGLNVEVLHPGIPSITPTYVRNGTDDLGVSHLPEIVLAREEGAPLTAVGSLISQPTAAMIWLKKSHINDIADLKGKTIGTPGLPFQKKFLENLLAREGLAPGDVTIKNPGYNLVPALVSGRVDAIFGGSWNLEGAQLEARGLKPVITRIQDLGFPSYDEFVVIARSDRVRKDPKLISDFMSAVARGTAAAIEDPEGAVSAVEGFNESNPETNHKETKAEVEATLPLLSKSGDVSSEQAKRLVDWMHEQGMIKRKPSPTTLIAVPEQ